MRPSGRRSRRYPDQVTDPRVPHEIAELARARRDARIERDWPEADRLKTAIEAAGWRVIDRDTHYRLEPADPPDVLRDGVLRHGSSRSVPSRLAEPPTMAASIVVVGESGGDAVRATLESLAVHLDPDTQVIVVDVPAAALGVPAAAGPGPDREPDTDGAAESGPRADPGPERETGRGSGPEIVSMALPVGPGAALNAGVRRALGEVIVVLAAGNIASGDVVAPLVAALADPTVALAGVSGTVTHDMRHFVPARTGKTEALDAVAVGATCLAFRRSDHVAHGPLDERFLTAGGLATWWSLVLRDRGAGARPRRALVIPGLPLWAPEPTATGEAVVTAGSAEADRRAKRDAYRIFDRFGGRPELAGADQAGAEQGDVARP